MFAELPVGLEDPVERLKSVSAQMQDLKRSKQAVAGDALTSLSGFAPALLLALGTRLAFRIPQRSLNTVTTNVPGPQQPLFLAGRRMLEAIPYVPIANQVRIGVAIFSYDGALKFGVTGDYDAAPDIGILCDGIEAGMAELVKAAQPAAVKAAHPGAVKSAQPADVKAAQPAAAKAAPPAAAAPAKPKPKAPRRGQAAARPAPGSATGATDAGGANSREST
jgi:hypothetical protein